jgi:glycosyltransferase involved in cell wall biosynthesis
MPALPRFSVIIATYNCAHFLIETLESVAAQSLRDLEIIVVDDGSTDDTQARLRPWKDRLRSVEQPNRGVAAAWNAGIRVARGEILAFLGADDHWEPETLERVAEAFDAHPDVGFVALTARTMDVSGRLDGRISGKRTKGRFYSTCSLLWGDSGGASFFFVRRAVMERVGLYDESLRSAEDCDLLLRLSFATRMMNLAEPLIRHREHAASLSQDRRTNARCWIRVLEKLARERPEFVARHRWTWHRALGKEQLRLGRETLAHGDPGAATWREARGWLARSIRTFPFFPRAFVYWGWSVIAPSTFRSWRRREVSRRLARSG